MLLQRLAEYAQRSGSGPPTGYSAEPVRYWIELDGEGAFRGVVVAEGDDRGRPRRVPVPTRVRAYAIKPKLLVDNGAYALGRPREQDKPERAREMHRAFVDLVSRAADSTGEPDVSAVERFLQSDAVSTLPLPADFDPKATIGFLVDGRLPTDLPPVQEFWAAELGEGPAMQCLVCGNERPAMERLDLKLKGIPGRQKGGLAIISANADPFLSFGLGASLVAPTCQVCADQFMKGANALIVGEDTHLRIGDVVYVFWTRDETAFAWGSVISRPQADDVRRLLESVYRGGATQLDPSPFYATAFSASGGRAVVRDWIDTSVEHAKRNLAEFFHLQSIVDWDGSPLRPLGVYALGHATNRVGSDDAPPVWLTRALVRCALTGAALPSTVLHRAIQRCRLESRVTGERAALIKMTLMSRHGVLTEGENGMVELDTTNRDPAYLCGRLFAELENAQHAALGDVGASIVDRYYGTASSAPATVFGRLIRGAQPHLAKLERDRRGVFVAIDRRLQGILESLEAFPTTLTLEQQGMFALGYYHQRAADRHAAAAHRGSRVAEPAVEGV